MPQRATAKPCYSFSMIRFASSLIALSMLALIGLIGWGFCSLVVTEGWASAFFFLVFSAIVMPILLGVCCAPFMLLRDIFRRPRGD